MSVFYPYVSTSGFKLAVLKLIPLITSPEKCMGVAEAQRHMALLRETLLAVSVTKASSPPLINDDCADKKASEYPRVMGFEQLITQRLLPPTFPRYSRLMFEYLNELPAECLFRCLIFAIFTSFHLE